MNIVKKLGRHYRRIRGLDNESRWFLITKIYIPRFIGIGFFPLSIILALLLRCLLICIEPLITIRFGRMHSQSIGTWDIPMELYLCQKDAGIHPPKSFDIFYHYDPDRKTLKNPPKITQIVPNKQIQKMVETNLRVIQSSSILDGLNRMISKGSGRFNVPLALPFDSDDLLSKYPPHFSFTEEEEALGKSELRRMGMMDHDKFVCFHARDGEFTYIQRPRMVSIYGDWQDQPYRNAKLENFLPVADHLSQLGYYVLRMGQWSKTPMIHDNPKVIDYATIFQNDFMDAYLSAKCVFFIGTNSGMTSIPMMYRRPLALVNLVPYSELPYSGVNDLFIPKKYHSEKWDRFLTLREVLSEPLLLNYSNKADIEANRFYDDMGISIVENSAEEICALVTELDDRMKGHSQYCPEDQELQLKFRYIMREHSDKYPFSISWSQRAIGVSFLKTYTNFLD